MRCIALTLMLAAAAGLPPVMAQTPAPTKDAGPKITLDVRRVPVKDAVAKLAEASGQTLSCADALARRKVTLIAQDQPAADAAAALARAACAHWRKEGEGLVLEPVDPMDTLTPEEVSAELQLLATQPGLPRSRQRDVQRAMLSQLSPADLRALQGPDGVPVTALTPQQRALIVSMLSASVAGSVRLLGEHLADIGRVGSATLELTTRNGQRVLDLWTGKMGTSGPANWANK